MEKREKAGVLVISLRKFAQQNKEHDVNFCKLLETNDL